jgi:hypothetical protein
LLSSTVFCFPRYKIWGWWVSLTRVWSYIEDLMTSYRVDQVIITSFRICLVARHYLQMA